MEWTELIEKFEKSLKKLGRSHSTRIAYIKDIQQLSAYCESQKLHNPKLITNLDLKGYIAFITQEGKFSTKTISRKINSLKTFFKYLLAQNYIEQNPGLNIRHPHTEPLVPRVLTATEYRTLRDSARTNRKIYTMVELLLQSGIRIGELSRLKRKDFYKSSDNKYFLHIEPFSTIPAREIELDHLIVACLQDYLVLVPNLVTNKGNFLFFTKSGRLMLIRNIRTALNRIFQKAGIQNATVNDLRNTFIMFQLESGMRIEKLAEVVGHRKSTTTQRYMQFVSSTGKKPVNKITPL